MDAFDADVLIYAAVKGHPLGRRVAALLTTPDPSPGVGSTLLLPELLSKPLREEKHDEVALTALLGRLHLHPLDEATASLAAAVAARYRLAPADAVHLATAVRLGADRFVTNNRRDFSRDITEVDVVYPDEL